MPRLLLPPLLLVIFLTSYSQQVALLDRSFKQPVTYTDSPTITMIEKGAFPLFVEDAGKLIEAMDWFLKNMNSTAPEMIATQELQWGNTGLYIHMQHSGRYKKYQLVLKTTMKNISTSLVLIDEEDPYPSAVERLGHITAYIKNNLALLKDKGNLSGGM